MPGYRQLHDWNVTPSEAETIQNRLRAQVQVVPLNVDTIQAVAGVDISFDKGSEIVFAGVVILRLPTLEVVERVGLQTRTTFPYIPGLLSFRESPPILEAWEQLTLHPDALICDGQGLAHPRRFGIACHLGVLLDLPTVGCAKSILVGRHSPVGEASGDWSPLIDRGETVGVALRTCAGVAPVYISVGHRCDLSSAIALVRRCVRATRVPETTRQAHLFVNELRRAGQVSKRP